MAKRTHCPDGRPLYRYNDLPVGLATKTMLARRRRKLTAGQPPVASYWTGHEYVPLYEVEASTELPAMTPKQQANWDAARTCARCGVLHLDPVPRRYDSGDRRLDDRCWRTERLAAQRPAQLALRMQARTWAREVLADPASVLLIGAPLSYIGGPTTLYAVDVHTGAVLVDVLVWAPWVTWTKPAGGLPVYEPRWERWPRPPGAVDTDQVLFRLQPLVGRRVLHQMTGKWNRDATGPLECLHQIGHLAAADPCAGGAVIYQRGDQVEQRYRHWLCDQRSDSRGEHGLYWPELSSNDDDAADVAGRTLALLRTMATDDHPDGPAVCPYLPLTGLEVCGRRDLHDDGLCGQHSLMVEAVRT